MKKRIKSNFFLGQGLNPFQKKQHKQYPEED